MTRLEETRRPPGRALVEKHLGRSVVGRASFLKSWSEALASGQPYAAGRIGVSENHWLYYPILLEQGVEGLKRRIFEQQMYRHAATQTGIFPGTPDFLLEYNEFYVESVHALDYLGMAFDPVMDPAVAARYRWRNPLVYYKDLEPDFSIPARAEDCPLPFLAGKKVLVIGPFADLLAARAERDVFESIWASTGRPWFAPASVEALTCPYGFSAETQKRYATVFELFEELSEKMGRLDFDVALVAVGGLSIPLIARAKQLGRSGLHFGGKLQLVFGVRGGRWRDRPFWRDQIMNEAWTDVPDAQRPPEAKHCNNGAYW